MDDYIIPDYFKDDIFYGSLSTTIDSALSTFNFSKLPQFNKLNNTEIGNGFRGYLSYLYIHCTSDIEQYSFYRLVKESEGEDIIVDLIRDYIQVKLSSTFTDDFLRAYEEDSKEKYFKMIRNVTSNSFLENSKAYDKKYLNIVQDYISQTGANIDPKILLTLTKCAIIESRSNPSLEREFLEVRDAVDYAYSLYDDQRVTYEERKREVLVSQSIMEGIDNIIDANGFER